MKKSILLVCMLLMFVSLGFTPAFDRETVYQGSTIEALLAGNYDGVDTVKNLKTKGDTGLGTFAGLDGEMIVVDGKVYKVAKNGKVTVEGDAVQTPFYAVTYFDVDITKKIAGTEIKLDSLKLELDKLRVRNDLPYTIIIKGTFKVIKVRSTGPYQQPYPLLSDALKEQNEIVYSDISGRLVGFWLPDYLGNTNAAGYHLHFLSDDSEKGGHVLDLVLTDAEIRLDETPKMHIQFSPYPTKPLKKPDNYKAL